MKQFNAIPVYPLRMRGRFGLTRHITRHGFWSAFFHTLFYAILLLLLGALSLAPLLLGVAASDAAGMAAAENVEDFFENFLEEYEEALPFGEDGFGFHSGPGYGFEDGFAFPDGPGSYGFEWRFEAPAFPAAPQGQFAGGGKLLLGLLLSLLLGLLSWAFWTFYLKPRYMGAMYNEMSSRVFGVAGSLRDIQKRSGACLKRYYGTYITLLLGKLGAQFVLSLLGGVVRFALVAGASFAFFLSPAAGAGALLLTLFVSWLIGYVAELSLCMVYPVAVNEERKDFAALWRAVQLAWRNFFRMLGSLLLRSLYIALWQLPGFVLLALGLMAESEAALALGLSLGGLAWLAVASLVFTPWRIAFNTVLYHDMCARAKEAAPAGGAPTEEAPAEEAHAEETPVEEEAPAENAYPVAESPEAEEAAAETAAQSAGASVICLPPPEAAENDSSAPEEAGEEAKEQNDGNENPF